jgi:dihydroorotate dehydrogenase subfamily 2
MKNIFISLISFLYRWVVRPILFRFDSEKVHARLTIVGEFIGNHNALTHITQKALRVDDDSLHQNLHGIGFNNPIGLAAGFDYEARLMHVLPSIGFGFGSVGTITNKSYEGNPYPRLGRLIKSKSLLVNKGFKNEGIDAVVKKLSGKQFTIPIGISIGKTNAREQAKQMTQDEAVRDVVSAFTKAKAGNLAVAYYELNISCPNLYGAVEFYSPGHLKDLLSAVTALDLTKPLFIKMPIEKTDREALAMLDVIVQFPVAGVIFGNLQKNRADPAIRPEEAARYPVGNFSGKPTQRRSDELIRLAYKAYGAKLTIIGCGGVFCAEDAYRKIRLGASLVQLITGLIYQGPQLPAEINAGLVRLLKKDGLKSISDAQGADAA